MFMSQTVFCPVADRLYFLYCFQSQATRERPRTGSQTNSSSVPVSVAPPPGQAQPVAQPAPQPVPQVKPPSVDLLGDLGGDPFAQQQQGQDFKIIS